MNRIKPKPFRIKGQIQNYAWGTKNENAYIPDLLNIKAEKDIPYAEYWLGCHPKAPSQIELEDEWILLPQIVESFPNEILGERIAKKFNNRLPFLLKVLSINQALSIQAHPDKQFAEILHNRDPQHYPDNNHKPEIAIAIDNLQAIVGLKEFDNLKSVLKVYNEIEYLLSDSVKKRIKEAPENDNIELVKEIYAEIMHSEKQKISRCIDIILDRIQRKNNRSLIEERFLIEYNNYGYDVGLLSLLLFNFVNLDSNEAIFTPAGIPHAYLKGNIIECMANSDNVVRAGLTPKFKDINTLVEMLDVDSSKTTVNLHKEKDCEIYKTPADEFQIEKITAEEYSITNNEELNIFLVLNGEIRVSMEEELSYNYKTGDVILIPAILSKYTVSIINYGDVYKISVP